ncbi:X-ray repair cross-complementing protein 5 [Ischnura elegans]|uniref:X-ray repair cross-complementing protein 5 n=1 Tax=Ischnura elegans TaxID=197161 RepID=UPI001ED8BFAC|nr:X-ray repair cross-complementing protein 5 [Ischnura elegans]
MTQKAAVVLILDLGYSEYFAPEDGEKYLKTARKCASVLVQSKIFMQSKDDIGLILMGYNGGSSKDIHVAVHLGPPSWYLVRQLNCDHPKSSKSNWIEAVIKALNVIRNKGGKYSERKIVIFSSNLGIGSPYKMPEHDIEDLVVELILIHPKTSKEPEFDPFRAKIKEAKNLVKKVRGTNISIEEAAMQLLSFQKKRVKPRPWNVCLDIGSKILIPVSGFKKMNESQALKWKNSLSSAAQSMIFPSNVAASTSQTSEAANFQPAVSEIAESQLTVENLPESDIGVRRTLINVRSDGKEVERSELIEGYHFGSDIVPFSEEDNKQMKYESGEKCLSVVKIVKKNLVPHHFWIGSSCNSFVARDGDEDAGVAFSALVQALDNIGCVAIVRRVYNANNRPRMGALFPVIKPTKEFLVFIELPFSSYMRKCILPELRVNHLNHQQFQAIDELIDGMDLSIPGDDDDSYRQWSELLVPHKVFDPYLQHVRACIASRILNPSAPLPEIDPKLYKMLTEPPQSIKEAVSDTLTKISHLFPNLGSRSDPPKKGRGKRAVDSSDGGESSSNVSDDVILAKKIKDEIAIKEEKVEEADIVGVISPIEDFKAALTSEVVPFSKVCQQMQHIILKFVINAFEMVDFVKPKECLKVLRNAVLADDLNKSDSVAGFNCWMKGVYPLLQEQCKLGFWNLVQQESLGFITSDECSESGLSIHEVNEILGGGESIPATLSDEEDVEMPLDL